MARRETTNDGGERFAMGLVLAAVVSSADQWRSCAARDAQHGRWAERRWRSRRRGRAPTPARGSCRAQRWGRAASARTLGGTRRPRGGRVAVAGGLGGFVAERANTFSGTVQLDVGVHFTLLRTEWVTLYAGAALAGGGQPSVTLYGAILGGVEFHWGPRIDVGTELLLVGTAMTTGFVEPAWAVVPIPFLRVHFGAIDEVSATGARRR